MAGLLDFLQGASNAAASNISGPIDLLGMGLRGVGVPVPQNAFGGSQWMRERGLTRDPQNRMAGLLGEAAGMSLPIAAAAKAPQIARGLLQAGDNLRAPNPMNTATRGQAGAIVYHGSPHKFDKFDSSKIGTGEGAQAYGHGLYFADSPKVAQSYKDLNPTVLPPPIRAFKGAELTPGTPEYHAATLLDNMGLQQARKTVAGWISSARPEMASEADGWRKTLETLNAATSKADFKQLKNQGNLYKVDLPDEHIARMLDWDKPWSQQPENVRKAIDASALEKFYNTKDLPTSQVLYHMNQAETPAQSAEYLRSLGIPGIRYLDGGSRGAGAGTSNYVVFPGNEGLLNILSRE